MTQSWEDDLGLPPFVLLLRIADGPVPRDMQHCGSAPDVAAVEEDDALTPPDPAAAYRVILQCRSCERYFWAWEGAPAAE